MPSITRRARRAILGLVIGDHWRTFVGVPYSELMHLAERTFDELDWEYSGEEEPPRLAERTVFGSKQNHRYDVRDPDLTVRCTAVTYDPITGFALNLGGSSETKEKYANRIALIDIEGIDDERESVSAFLRTVADELDHPPWKCDHPRFYYSPLLRYKIKLLWEFWLEDSSA